MGNPGLILWKRMTDTSSVERGFEIRINDQKMHLPISHFDKLAIYSR